MFYHKGTLRLSQRVSKDFSCSYTINYNASLNSFTASNIAITFSGGTSGRIL
jgi:hypothetical protein